jgi:hypothetical protein
MLPAKGSIMSMGSSIKTLGIRDKVLAAIMPLLLTMIVMAVIT